eukprot:SAG22_NODE_55_length_23749_cov_24.622918_3_plen_199_part_00
MRPRLISAHLGNQGRLYRLSNTAMALRRPRHRVCITRTAKASRCNADTSAPPACIEARTDEGRGLIEPKSASRFLRDWLRSSCQRDCCRCGVGGRALRCSSSGSRACSRSSSSSSCRCRRPCTSSCCSDHEASVTTAVSSVTESDLTAHAAILEVVAASSASSCSVVASTAAAALHSPGLVSAVPAHATMRPSWCAKV